MQLTYYIYQPIYRENQIFYRNNMGRKMAAVNE